MMAGFAVLTVVFPTLHTKTSFPVREHPLTKTSVIRHKPNIYVYMSKEKNPSNAYLHSVYAGWATFMGCLLQILVP